MICKSGAPTLDGGKSSSMKENTSLTGPTKKHLMFTEDKIMKDKRLLSGRNTVEPTRNGRLSILTNLRRNKLKVSTRTSDLSATNHSTSDPDFQ
jgi:hypothetical protein